MKRIIFSLIILAIGFTSKAQEEMCGSDHVMNQLIQSNPALAEAMRQDSLMKANRKQPHAKSNHKIIIPVVVHVMHYNNQGNISKAQILDGIRVMNEDFNKLNADTSTIRPVFQGLAESMDIEFRLAQKDPNGFCTDGITRTNTYLTNGSATDAFKIVQWPVNNYMNVWLTNSLYAPGIQGYAYKPPVALTNPGIYGLSVRNDQWGTIGSASGASFGGRVASHEMGHTFGLDHPFRSGCPLSFQSCHNSGDFICDVPPQINDLGNQCPNASTCSGDTRGGVTGNPNPFTTDVVDQVENIMGYGSNCLSMMTGGQKNLMDGQLTTNQVLRNLTDTSNLTRTGTNDGYVAPLCEPVAEILSFDKFGCSGSPIVFTENSYGGAISTYSWSFPGGTPSTSTQAQPAITYSAAGNYDVTLRVTNAAGTDSVVLTDYVHISDSINIYSGFNYTESFENPTLFANEWVIIDNSPTPAWSRASFAGKTGSSSVWLNNLNTPYNGARDQLISPAIKMSDVVNPSISVEVAYRRKNSSSNDRLIFSASIDCGESWITILSTTPAFFAFDNSTQTTNFVPTQGSQWKTVSIPAQFIPAAIKTADRVKFRFEFEHQEGNNVYVDDFKILGQPTSLGENQQRVEENVMVYPNPANDQFNLVYRPKQEGQTNIYLRNVIGEKVQTIFTGNMTAREYKFLINSSALSKGVYFLSIEGDERITKKVVVR